MMKDWSDAKRNIAEHIVLSIAVFTAALLWDHIVNLLAYFSIFIARGSNGQHPYRIGETQIIAMAISAWHFVRKLNEFRYYGNLIPERLQEMIKREI